MKKQILLLSLLSISACAMPVKQAKQAVQQPAEVATPAPAENIDYAEKAFSEGDYEKAASLYKETLNVDNSTANLFKYAESQRLGGDSKSALKTYDKILEKDPEALYALEGKSLCFVKDGEFKKAATLLGQIINKDASRWRVINALGVVYAITGHAKESMEYYNMALQVSNNNPSVLNNMGLSVAFNGDFEKGRQLVQKALDNVDADDAKKRQSIDYNLALIYGMAGKMDEAEKILDKYLPKPAVLNNLGYYAKLAHDNKSARAYLGKALASSPVHYEKAWENLQSVGGGELKKSQ